MKKVFFIFLTFFLLLYGGCSDFHAKRVDDITRKTIDAGRVASIGEKKKNAINFYYTPLETKGTKEKDILAGEKKIPVGYGEPVDLTLNECLYISYRNSRNIQNRKDALYSSAMSLANNRRSWDFPLFDLTVDGTAAHRKINNGPESNILAGAAELSMIQRFVNGGVLTAAFAVNAFTDFATDRSTSFGSFFETNFSQPLLRGAWRELAYEDMYRQERDFLFDLFDYERFVQTFTVSIISEYYSVLRQRDALENNKRTIESLKDTFAVTAILAEAGQVSQVQVDQAEQDLLNSQIELQINEQALQDRLDNFKISLGLPIDAQMNIDYGYEKKKLGETGTEALEMDLDTAIAIAIRTRADILRRRADLRDAYRNVVIAEDQLNPNLDLVMGLKAEDSGDNTSARVKFGDHTRFVELKFDYAFDQFDNTENYRNSLIALDRTKRDVDEFEDRVVLSVREAYRSLIRSKNNYELQLRSVEVSMRRTKLSRAQQKGGQASTRDVLEAEDALRRAQDGLTVALVGYTTTRLEFLADIGMIEVDSAGLIRERIVPQEFNIIAEQYPYVRKGKRNY